MLKMHFLLLSLIILIAFFLLQNLLPKLVHLQYFVNHKLSGRQATIVKIDFVYVNNQILQVNLFQVDIMPLFTYPGGYLTVATMSSLFQLATSMSPSISQSLPTPRFHRLGLVIGSLVRLKSWSRVPLRISSASLVLIKP